MHFLCLVLFAVVLHGAFVVAHPRLEKLRRGSSGLVPFPRVGRGPALSWEVPPEEWALADAEEPQKRPLYAFPRVGRRGEDAGGGGPLAARLARLAAALRAAVGGAGGGGGARAQHAKRSSDSGNMWFGPRLGRSAAAAEIESYDEDSASKSAWEPGNPEIVDINSETVKQQQAN